MAFKKGRSGNPLGRQPGSKNRFTTLKEKFLEAFQKTGGVDGLANWINANPRNRGMFYQMLTKLFPQEQVHSGEIKTDGQLTVKVVQLKDQDGNGNSDK